MKEEKEEEKNEAEKKEEEGATAHSSRRDGGILVLFKHPKGNCFLGLNMECKVTSYCQKKIVVKVRQGVWYTVMVHEGGDRVYSESNP
jgi:hypothetical protein